MQRESSTALPRVLVPALPRAGDIALVLGASLFVALMAQASVNLPFSPVPITGQTFAVLLVGAALGSKRGAAAILTYLLEGAAGLPVFHGGTAGPAVLVGPTGGYLMGFVAAAWAVGLLAERGLDRKVPTALLIFLAGDALIFVCGLAVLAFFVGLPHVLVAGLWPFLPGDAIKIGLGALALPAAWKIVQAVEGR